jgi:hypothetical protein
LIFSGTSTHTAQTDKEKFMEALHKFKPSVPEALVRELMAKVRISTENSDLQ